MSVIEAIILGIVQGLTEFLPVSSSGHIELGKAILNINTADNLLFSIVVHGATALSTLIVFRKDIFDIFKGLLQFRNNESFNYVLKILISMIPVGLVGIFFEDRINALFTGNVVFVGFMLVITGILLTFTYYAKNTTQKVSYDRAIIIGVVQALAILPGISRSGSTISSALILGVDKEKATKFSFIMVLLPIIGATFLKLNDYSENPTLSSGIGPHALIIGFLAAFLSGLLACTWMIKIVKRGKLIYFAYYCFFIGLISIVIGLI
ncbi:MAG: undecaprenyl-diphosphate phosphatase [Cyclobacteriaceae bacterium]|nr:undecaprenyl-diphosphate phosphatase [Cyclobacteriaceae bacterium]